VRFASGAEVVLEGPVALRCESRNGASLIAGKLHAQVPKQARGFVVETPSASVTDLGTEFGVLVNELGETETAVFQGSVILRLAAGDGSSSTQATLVAGQSAETRAGSIVVHATPGEDRFVKRLPEKAAGDSDATRAIAVVNSNFERPNIANGGTEGDIAIPGWMRLSGDEYLSDRNGLKLIATTDPTPDATDNEQLLITVEPNAGVFQVTSEPMAADAVYTLTVDVGDRTNFAFPKIDLRIGTGSTFGKNLLAPTIVSSPTPHNGAGAADGWETWVYSFTGGAGVPGENLRVEMFQSGAGPDQALLDNVRLTAKSTNSTASD
ncbi:MAG: FecR domain-containing protein, partial [Planctomycetales bacterium]|nr:FecR domain-containing protein [Planctomycetales bacterium]